MSCIVDTKAVVAINILIKPFGWDRKGERERERDRVSKSKRENRATEGKGRKRAGREYGSKEGEG